ncbi:MAG: hypothetical protein LLG00_14975 [Planctomycetaceae bacterium]|nr:hypothetical protein [Planctomycetaceae bacterium]
MSIAGKTTCFGFGLFLAATLAMGLTIDAAQAAVPNAGDSSVFASPGAKALATAAKNNKYLFVFFWRDDTQRSRQVRAALQSALPKLADKADSVEIRTTDEVEKQLVARFGASRSPMPLVLAVAPNGAVTKGFLTPCDERQLREAFVSPCTAECMKHLQAKKLVVLCVWPKAPKVRQVSLQQGVKDFTEDADYAANVAVVNLNAGDAAEVGFLRDLKVDPQTATPVTLLMAPPASVVATLTGDVTKEQLVAKLTAAQSGCCPGGKCGPGGCGQR